MTVAFRNFFVTFVISVLVFSLAGFYFYDNILPSLIEENLELDIPSRDVSSEETSDDQTSDDDTSIPDNVTVKGNKLTVLLLGMDSVDKTRIASIMMVHVHDGYKSYILSSIDPEMSVLYADVNVKLGDIYTLDGIDELKNKIKFMTGFDIDYHIISTPESLVSMSGMFGSGGLNYMLTYDITASFVNPDTGLSEILLKRGNTVINEENIKKIFEFAPSGSEASRLDTVASIYYSVFNSIFTNQSIKESRGKQKQLLDCNTTDITQTALDESGALIFTFNDESYKLHKFDYPYSSSMQYWSKAVAQYSAAEKTGLK